MNIKRAKEEIKNTVRAYLETDKTGKSLIPEIRQRPVFLIGPPGIGKTAIIEQVARECNVGVASYTMTHHTRQSAMGLPFISKKEFDGQTYSVTEYTMSEIIASVHDKIKTTGMAQGILFIDEINCVSETLAPIMLQFLQAKTFGNAKVPSGWVIVAAGNPPEYNRSVREFDVVTLDRVKKIDVEADYQVWKEYAMKHQVHQAVLSYLESRQESFYRMETSIDGKYFVTARGWEDLSDLIKVYEKLGIHVDEEVIAQYIQHPDIAIDFSNYLALYYKYEKSYSMQDILAGNVSNTIKERIGKASFDERVSVVSLMLGSLNHGFIENYHYDRLVTALFDQLKHFQKNEQNEQNDQNDHNDQNNENTNIERNAVQQFEMLYHDYHAKFDQKKTTGMLDSEEEKLELRVLQTMNTWLMLLKAEGTFDKESAFERLRTEFMSMTDHREALIAESSQQLEHAFDFAEEMFVMGPELVLFVTELSAGFYSLTFIEENGCERFYKYNKTMLRDKQRQELTNQIEETLRG